jgi:WD40 repeat protein
MEPTSVPAATATPVPPQLLEKSPQEFGYTETYQVGLGDLDGDGDLDAVFANMAANDSKVWLNDGVGQFVDSGQVLTQQGHGLGLGDLDGDGDLDLFITCAHFNSGGGWSKKPSRVYFNDGTGGLQSGENLGDEDLSGNDVNLFDVDGDGDLDAHVVYYEAPDRVYLNDGQGGFNDSGLALSPEEIAWGDLDGDGDVDLFGKTHGQGYGVGLNDGMGQFADGWQMEDGRAMIGSLELGDLDGDGDLDALVANGFRTGGSYPTMLLWNDGSGQFSDSGQSLNETKAADFGLGDLDGDGDLDVFVVNMDLPNEVWLNDGAGQLLDSGLRLQGAAGSMNTQPSLGDLDGDGDLDVFVASFRGPAEVWFNVSSSLTPTAPPTPTAAAVKRLREWADLRPGKGPVYSQDWSPDGRLLVTADYDQVRVWDTSSRQEAGLLLGHRSFVWGLAWSPDGSVLASASQDGSVRLWDVSNYTETAVMETGWAFCVAWSPDGSQLAVGNETGQVQIWDVAGQQLLDTWSSSSASLIISIAWSPDGKTVASGEWGGEIYLWDAETGQVRTSYTGYTTRRCDVNGLDWSPDGNILASAHQDGQVRLWDVETGQMVRAIEAHTGWARGVAWSPSGHLLASTGEDKRICLWDPETGQEYAEEHHNHLPVWSASWSPDGGKVASGAGAYEEKHVGATIVWAVP